LLYLTKIIGKYDQNGFSAVDCSILGQPPSQTRYELIYYVLLKTDTNLTELNKLKEAILSKDEHPMWGIMESEHILELMDKLAA